MQQSLWKIHPIKELSIDAKFKEQESLWQEEGITSQSISSKENIVNIQITRTKSDYMSNSGLRNLPKEKEM